MVFIGILNQVLQYNPNFDKKNNYAIKLNTNNHKNNLYHAIIDTRFNNSSLLHCCLYINTDNVCKYYTIKLVFVI